MQWRYVIAIASVMMQADISAGRTQSLFAGENASMPAPFVTAMTRARLAWIVHGWKPLGQPIEGTEPPPSRIPFYWEGGDGSSIRRMPDGSFRLEEWSLRSNWARMIACNPAAWPNYECSDGISRVMSAPDLSTVSFGDRTYTRILAQAEPNADAVLPIME